MHTGVRDLKNNLSSYIRRVEGGEHVIVTAHGRVVAEIVPPMPVRKGQSSQFERLIASGVIAQPTDSGDPLEGCPKISLPPGTAAGLIDNDRDEA